MDDCPRHHCLNCDFDFYVVWNYDGVGLDFDTMHCPRCGDDDIETTDPLTD